MNSFDKFHPITNLIFFSFIIIFSMFNMHPVFLLISFTSAFIYSLLLKGVKALKFNLFLILFFVIFAIVINPLLNHQGITVLFYFDNGSPITLEAIIYGVSSAVMILTVIFWFSCFNEIITDDKIIYLFGKIIPSLSLVISMIFRFVPKFKNQYKVVMDAQKALNAIDEKKFFNRIITVIKVISIMITWSMENAIETSDSMNSRGYGIKKRTSFHLYKFENRDLFFIIITVFLATFVLIFKQKKFVYFPALTNISFAFYPCLAYVLFFFLCFMPIILEFRRCLCGNNQV